MNIFEISNGWRPDGRVKGVSIKAKYLVKDAEIFVDKAIASDVHILAGLKIVSKPGVWLRLKHKLAVDVGLDDEVKDVFKRLKEADDKAMEEAISAELEGILCD